MNQFRIGVGAVNIHKNAFANVQEALRLNRLTYGKFSEQFEKKFAKLHQRKVAIFCNSGTSALQVGFHALKKNINGKMEPRLSFPH